MADLYPTKTRLALLQDVADGAVFEHYPMLPDPVYSQLDRGAGWGSRRRVKVTAKVAELNRAGWIRISDRAPGDKTPRRWDITDAGRAVLEAHR